MVRNLVLAGLVPDLNARGLRLLYQVPTECVGLELHSFSPRQEHSEFSGSLSNVNDGVGLWICEFFS